MIKEKPIPFKPPMVEAILGGYKTQTRRPLYALKRATRFSAIDQRYEPPRVNMTPAGFPDTPVGQCWQLSDWSKAKVGDRLWVRERHRLTTIEGKNAGNSFVDFYDGGQKYRDGTYYLPANHFQWDPTRLKWRPPMFMPRWASRITLEVTGVRVERLQEISEADAIAEGLVAQEGDGLRAGPGFKWSGTGYHGGTFSKTWGRCFHTPSHANPQQCGCDVGFKSPAQCGYRELWEHINGAESWAANPWVSVISFRRVVKP